LSAPRMARAFDQLSRARDSASVEHLLNLYFRARRAWRILCVRSEATAQNVTKKISG